MASRDRVGQVRTEENINRWARNRLGSIYNWRYDDIWVVVLD